MRKAPYAVVVVDDSGNVDYANDAVRRVLGFDREDLLGRSLVELFHPLDRDRISRVLDGARGEGEEVGLEFGVRHAHGGWRRMEVSTASFGGSVPGADKRAVYLYDMTSHRALQDELAHRALHDSLTGLANRSLLLDRLRQGLARYERHGHSLAVLLADLDDFKAVNDTLGHAFGDGLLEKVAQRMRACVRPEDTVARLGGDEFALVVSEANEPEDALRLAHRICSVVGQRMHLEGRAVEITASVGVAQAGSEMERLEDLVAAADAAMYRAKASGGNRACAHEQTPDGLRDRVSGVGSGSEEPLMPEGLETFFRPIVDPATGMVRSMEAVAQAAGAGRRGSEPGLCGRGLHDSWPAEPILAAAFEYSVRWNREFGPVAPLVLVALSAAQWQQGDLTRRIRALLRETGCRPERILLGLPADGPEMGLVALSTLNECAALGFRFMPEEPGLGLSCYELVRRLSAEVIRLHSVPAGPLDPAFPEFSMPRKTISLAMELAHSIGLEVIVDNVDSRESYEMLREASCDLLEGGFVGEAVPGESASKFLREGLDK